MRKSGFTIIEVMVSSVMLIALGFGILGLQQLFSQNELTAFNTYANVTETNQVLTQFIREIRRTTSSENGSYALVTLDDNEIIFYSDYDLDGIIERVRYSLIGDTITKGIIEPVGSPAVYDAGAETTKIITEHAVNTTPLFRYYNSSWPDDTTNNPLDQISRLSDTQTIRIFLLVNSRPGASGEEYVLDSFVQPRMLKRNL